MSIHRRFPSRSQRWIVALPPLLAAAGCGLQSGGGGGEPAARASSRSASDSLYVGVAASRSASGTAFFRGVELAVAELNAARPAGSPPFAMRMPAEGQASQVAVAAAFRDDPAVIGVVGHTGSAQTLDAAPVYGDVEHGGRNAVVAVTPTATNPAVSRASEWVFRICPTDDDAARALAQFAADSVRAKRVAVVYRNDLFGRGFTRTLTPLLEASGARVVERDPYLTGVTAYAAYAERIVRNRADAIVVAGGAADAADMIRALRHAGGNPTVLGTDDVAGIGSDAAAAREFRGVRFTSFYLADRPAAGASNGFADRYRERFGETPGHRSALAYDAAMLIGRAALAVGPDRARIRDWIARIGRTSPSYAGATGEIRFDETGGAVGKQVIVGEVGQ